MRYLFIAAFNFILISAIAQKQNPSRIIITVQDTAGIYDKVKTALIKTDFIVKDLKSDTLQTYARELNNLPGYALAFAVIENNTVTVNGYYSLKRTNDIGYTSSKKDYKKITKYKGSKTWPLLEKIAKLIGDKIAYR